MLRVLIRFTFAKKIYRQVDRVKEISVLDYLKLIIKKRDEGSKLPTFPFSTREQKIKKKSSKRIEPSASLWRLILSILCALFAQSRMEPPHRDVVLALILYCLSGVMFFLTIRCSREKNNHKKKHVFNQEVRSTPFIFSILLILIAFFAFRDNIFNLFNLSLWGAAILLFVYAVWDKQKKIPNRVIPLDNWTLIFIVIIGIVFFFRIFELNSVPGEMFSDHAEKLLDVLDILNGKTPIFFIRNTGREAFQFYLTSLIISIFGTGISFLSLKIGTVVCGLLTLPFLYLIGKEIGNRQIGLLAFLLAGIAYWPNIISRIGLRYTLYPLFVAPALFYLVLGLRNNSRNDFILSGIFLGIGLHGYSPIRILPFLIVVGSLLALLHSRDPNYRKQIIWNTVLLALTAFFLFLPLFTYAVENPAMFSIRAISRLTSIEQPISSPVWLIFVRNLWNALTMFFYSNGEVWVHSIPLRPALDMITAIFFFLGLVYVLKRYLTNHDWTDLFLLLSIPFLMLPSILSLAFPRENPSLNRTAGAIVPVFIISALGMGSTIQQTVKMVSSRVAHISLTLFFGLLILLMLIFNYKLVFYDYKQQYMQKAWNTSEIGTVILKFVQSGGNPNNAFVVPYPYWVDTRLVGINAGYPQKDYALWPEEFISTLETMDRKLFILNQYDSDSLIKLQKLYPQSKWQLYISKQVDKNFILLFTN